MERYVAAWVMLGVVALGVVIVFTDVRAPALAPLVALVVGVTVAERVELRFTFEHHDVAITLVEVAIAAGLLLVAPTEAVVAVGLGMMIGQASRVPDLVKVSFNTAQAMVGTSIAALLLHLGPSVGPLVNGRSVPLLLLGMVAYTTLNLGAILGLLTLAETSARAGMVTQLPLSASFSMGNAAIGVVLATLLVREPALAPLILVPAGAIYLAARGSRRAAELLEHVRTDRDRLTRVVDGTIDGILLLDRDGTILVWNSAMEELTGLPADRVVSQPVERVLTDALREGGGLVSGRWLIDDAHHQAQRRAFDTRYRHIDGTAHEVRENHSLLFDDRGRCIGDVVVVRDVSRQRELERLRGDFVARVSHELRTPLTPIRGFASVLLRKGDQLDAASRQEALERIVERSDHLAAVVEDLLLVTRLDQHELDELVHPEPIDVAPLLASVLDHFREREPGRTLLLTTAPGTGQALADPQRTRQIVSALVDNACRYSPVDAPVEVSLEQEMDDIVVRVRDSGPGIPRESREAIFEQFQRLEDPLTMRTGGVGLGLFIGRRLAEAMHGSLQLAPPSGTGGSVFVLRLPSAIPAHGSLSRPLTG